MKEDGSVRYRGFSAGDVVLWDGKRKLIVRREKYNTDVYPAEEYTPIGILVIPATHMEDCRARMMSLKFMNCDDPENGSMDSQDMIWGNVGDVSGLTNFTEVPVIARYDDEDEGGVVPLTEPQEIYTANTYAFLPSDHPFYTGETNPEDEGTRWRIDHTFCTDAGEAFANNFYAPSPYTKFNEKNLLYMATSYSGGTISNPLSYFDGRHQTDVILALRGERDYGSWKPTAGAGEDYPAASCCDMYHTVGTNQGDWYLPSCAELGYVVPRLKEIVDGLSRVGGIVIISDENEDINDDHGCWFWSSTEYDTYNVRHVNYGYGNVFGEDVYKSYPYNNHTIAFCPI